MSGNRVLDTAEDSHKRGPAGKRLWLVFLDALISLAVLPPEPCALELADVARIRQSVA